MVPCEDGMTLTEVLVATALAMVVLFGILTADVARFRMGEDIRQRSSVTSAERGRAAFAIIHLTKHLERADRLDLGATTPGLYQFRWPAGCTQATLPGCLDVAANYDWDQYRLTGSQLEFNTNRGTGGCGAWTALSRQIAGFTVQYSDEAPAPPGGDPVNQDNNMVRFTIQWNDTASLSQDFTAQVAIRGGAYTNVDTGLSPVSPPSAACP